MAASEIGREKIDLHLFQPVLSGNPLLQQEQNGDTGNGHQSAHNLA
jgi:hypothetical protein